MPRRAGVSAAYLVLLVTAPASAQVEAERWTLSGNLRETFSDNVFLSRGRDVDEWITGATLSLAYGRLGQRSSLSGLGWLNGGLYREFDEYNRVQYGLGLSGQLDADPRMRLRAGASFADGINFDSLYASRLGLPQVDVKSGSAFTGLTYEVTPSTFANASLDVSGLRYRADFLFDSSQLPGDVFAPPDVLQPLRPGSVDPQLPIAPDGAQFLALLSAEGIRTLSLDYIAWRAGVGLSHELSDTTRVSVDAGYRRTYESPSEFADGEQVEAQAALRHVFDQSATASLSYAYQESRFRDRARAHSATAQADKELSRRLRFDASVGVSWLDGPADASGATIVGGAGFSLRLDRTSVAARYTRSRFQGPVLGRSQVSDVVFASVGHTFGKRLFGSVFGYYRTASDDLDRSYTYSDAVLGASLALRIKRRGNIGGSYTFQHFDSAGFPATSRSTLSVSLGYSRTWK
jgi:hypothetical protein